MNIMSSLKFKLFSLPLLLLGSVVATDAIAATTVYEKNELRIVITPDHYPIIWRKIDTYGVDFTYSQSEATHCADIPEGLALCSVLNLSRTTPDAYSSFRSFQVKEYVTVIVFYDGNGNIIASSETDSTPPAPPTPPIAEAEPDASNAQVGNFSGSLSYYTKWLS